MLHCFWYWSTSLGGSGAAVEKSGGFLRGRDNTIFLYERADSSSMAFNFDLRKILIVFIIATLIAVLAYSITAAIMPRPAQEDYCGQYYPRAEPYGPGTKERPSGYSCPAYDGAAEKQCTKDKGMPDFTYNEYGCPASMTCNYCIRDFMSAQKRFNFIMFITDSIIAVIAILIGLNLPGKKEVNNWIGIGLLFGGLITLFVGTVAYYSDLGRYVRPVVIFVELALVIYLSYKKLSEK